MELVFVSEGLRIGLRSLGRKLFGWKRYPGDVKAICDGILHDCWNGRFLCASAGHFRQFYSRDIGIASPFLTDKREQGIATLSYVIDRFAKAGKVTVAITPSGKPFDFPVFAVDSLPFLLRALRVFKAASLVKTHKVFLESEIARWHSLVVAEDGFVKRNVHFSSMRDHAIRSSSCYDNAMVLLLKKEAAALRLRTPPLTLTSQRFVKEFWTGAFFRDDRDVDAISGDANVVPFWLCVVDDRKKQKAAIQSLHDAGMDVPIPLCYTPTNARPPKMIREEVFVPGWEYDARWMQSGLMFIQLAKQTNKDIYEISSKALRENILKNQNILEVFTPQGKPYKSAFYHADEGMLWGAALARKVL